MNQNPNGQTPQMSAPLSMVAPESKSQYERKEDHEIIKMTAGSYICRLYGIVDMGTQYNQTFNKESRRISLLFEFPHILQDFYKRKPGEESKLQPVMVRIEETFSMNSKANFRKLIEGALGKRFTDEQAKTFNVFELLGQSFLAQVILDPDKKNPQKFYERIQALMPYQENFKLPNVEYKPYNEIMAYSVDLHGFSGPNWLALWNKFREKIKRSKEGQAHAAKGGAFQEPPREGESNNSGYGGPQAPSGYQPQQPQQVTQQPQAVHPQQMGIQAAAAAAPPPVQQQAPAPVAEKQFVITHENKDLQSWLASNWTKEMMVKEGYAQWVDSVQ